MVAVSAKEDIIVEAIGLIVWEGTNIQLDFYTLEGSHNDNDLHSNPLAWGLPINNTGTFSLDTPQLIDFAIPPTEVRAGSVRSFYVIVSSDNGKGLYVGSKEAPEATDGRIEIQSPARVFLSSDPFGGQSFPLYSL